MLPASKRNALRRVHAWLCLLMLLACRCPSRWVPLWRTKRGVVGPASWCGHHLRRIGSVRGRGATMRRRWTTRAPKPSY